MTRKLTLSADAETISRAKRYARQHNTSVSALFERFVRALTSGKADKSQERFPISPTVRKLSGIARWPEGKTERDLIDEAVCEKYGVER